LLLEKGGADVHQRADGGQTALMAALVADHTATLQVLLDHGAGDLSEGSAEGSNAEPWMGIEMVEAAEALGRETAALVIRAYESEFMGNILPTRGGTCVASWPGIYAKLWDKLVAQAKSSELSAAVVFLPEKTPHFGKHGSDKCYCVEVSWLGKSLCAPCVL
jgi:hypothetical protein